MNVTFCKITIFLFILFFVCLAYCFYSQIKNKLPPKVEFFQDEQTHIDPVIPNQLYYWKDRKKGIRQDYENDKFFELDAQGDLHLTSRDQTYQKYSGKSSNYIGPLKKNDEYIVIKGHNLEKLKNISLEKCKNTCDNLENCQGISYHKADRKCALEKYSCDNPPNSCSITKSGWRGYEKLETNDKLIESDKIETDFSEVKHDITVLGNNIKHIKPSTLQKCLKECHKNPMCAAASFRKNDCYLEGKTCQQAGKDCVKGKDAKGWMMYELINSASNGGMRHTYYPVRIHNRKASIKDHNYKTLKAASLNKCIHQCNLAGNKCKGIEYKPKNQKCQLSSDICRSVGSKCSSKYAKGWEIYEKNKYLGPYYIVCKKVYRKKPYLAMKPVEQRGVPLIMSATRNAYSKWIFHPDSSIQNVGTKLFISFSGNIQSGEILVSGTARRRWYVEKPKYKIWNFQHNFGNILYIKDKNYFLFNNSNGKITAEVEMKDGKRKNPNYLQCKRNNGDRWTEGKKYIHTGKIIYKRDKRAQWSIVRTSF